MNHEENKFFKTENICLRFALNFSANKIQIIHNVYNTLLYSLILDMLNIKTFK